MNLIESLLLRKKKIKKQELCNTDEEFCIGNNMSTNVNNNTIYTVSGVSTTSTSTIVNGGYSIATSGGYSWASHYPAHSTASQNMVVSGCKIIADEITINRKNNPIKIGETLDLIMETLYIVNPDVDQHKNNPALKAAYDEWYHQFKLQSERMTPLKEAYDSYIILQKLCKEEED